MLNPTLSDDADQLRRRVLEELLPLHHQFRSYRLPGERTTVPDSAESLYRLAMVLGGLFNFPTGLRLRETSPPLRARMRSPRSKRPTGGQALRDGPISTWRASVEQLAGEPR